MSSRRTRPPLLRCLGRHTAGVPLPQSWWLQPCTGMPHGTARWERAGSTPQPEGPQVGDRRAHPSEGPSVRGATMPQYPPSETPTGGGVNHVGAAGRGYTRWAGRALDYGNAGGRQHAFGRRAYRRSRDGQYGPAARELCARPPSREGPGYCDPTPAAWALQDGPKNFVLPTMLFYHAIRAVHPHATDLSSGDTATSLVPASRYATAKPDQTEIDRRRAVICEALSRQRVPYALQQPANGHIAGDDIVVRTAPCTAMCVLGTLVCSAPYMSSSIQCENEMVLGRFRELLRALDV
eukprot:scaffold9776_cov126-Isochrysis_galbana.AAC.12